jgi:2,5-diketo-D-gluconate reductase A
MLTSVPNVILTGGLSIPQLGFGTAHALQADIEAALAAGYRHIDTATMYGNETAVGGAVRASGLDRSEVFVTTKLNNPDHRFGDVIGAVERSLSWLDFDYIDLYLIHWPMPAYDRYVETWRKLFGFVEEGRIRAIGVANFQKDNLQRLIDETGEAPAVNQVEIHPLFQQPELRSFHAAHGIASEAWGPLAKRKYDLDALGAIAAAAQAHGKTSAQVVLRWHMQEGTITIPKTSNPARVKENIDIFDFVLSDDEMAAMRALDTGVRTDVMALDQN